MAISAIETLISFTDEYSGPVRVEDISPKFEGTGRLCFKAFE